MKKIRVFWSSYGSLRDQLCVKKEVIDLCRLDHRLAISEEEATLNFNRLMDDGAHIYADLYIIGHELAMGDGYFNHLYGYFSEKCPDRLIVVSASSRVRDPNIPQNIETFYGIDSYQRFKHLSAVIFKRLAI